MELRQVCLRRGEERDLRRGKRRVYDNEAAWVDEGCTDGEVVDVVDGKGNFVARGFLNSRSKILVRILTQDPNEVIDSDFLPAAWPGPGPTGRPWGFLRPAGWFLESPTVCRGSL